LTVFKKQLFCAARAGLLAFAMAGACAAQGQPPAASGGALYYYQGRHRVEVVLDTEKVAVETTAPLGQLTAALPMAARGGITSNTAPGGKVLVATSGRSRAELAQTARQIRATAPGARVQALLQKKDGGAEVFLQGQISFQLAPGKSPAALAAQYGLSDLQPVSYSPRTYTATVSTDQDVLAPVTTANQMQESGDATWASPSVEQQQQPRVLNDPLLPNQWYLQNTGANAPNGSAGNDLNVFPVWAFATGQGVNISINDSGVEMAHPDLSANIRPDLSFDFNGNDTNPNPSPTQGHGTSVAGVAAARGNNGIGVAGAAPSAGIAALRILASPVTDAVQGNSLSWKAGEAAPNSQVFVSTNSWGPTDNGQTLEGPGPLSEAAIEHGILNGRNGKGIVYVWAAGNGRMALDNINKDGYGNNPRVIAVGATRSDGKIAYYSEPGSAVLVNAPGGDVDRLYTTDMMGANGSHPTEYRPDFFGTSAAAPAVAGVVALLLDLRPDLTWRDVMHLLVQTATKNDPGSADWETNGAGYAFHHDYGFGRVNAAAAAAAAATWSLVPPLEPVLVVNNVIPGPVSIPDNSVNGQIFEVPVAASPHFRVEHVELEVDITHPFRGDVVILLQSPSGMISEILPESNDSGDHYSHWRFRSVAHWGENPAGNWRVLFADVYAANTGMVNSASLRISGHEVAPAAVRDWNLY
jgi:subtilisin-like proprotein convertase family protein